MSTLENMSEIESSLPLATIEDILLNAKDKLNESSTLLGGKMYHIFEHKNGIYSQNVNYEKNNIQDEKEFLDIINLGKYYHKIDGGNGLLIYQDSDMRYYLFKRFDNKTFKSNNKSNIVIENTVEVPNKLNPSVYETNGCIHKYYQELVPREKERKNKLDQALILIYKDIDLAHKSGRFMQDGKLIPVISVELVGPNYSKTPGVSVTTLAIHNEQIPNNLNLVEFNSNLQFYEFLKDYFSKVTCEGLVICYKNKYYKILANMFVNEDGTLVSKWKTADYQSISEIPITLKN
jgi:hypothetical protein